MPTKVDFPLLKLTVKSIHTRVDKTTVYFTITEQDPFGGMPPLHPTAHLDITNEQREQFPDFKVGEYYVFRRSIEVDER